VANVLVDIAHEKDWIDSIVEARVLKKETKTQED